MKRIWKIIVSWFHRSRNAELPAVQKVAKVRREKEHFGTHFYLGDLLDNIEGAFSHMRALARVDPDTYDMARNLGVAVSSSSGSLAIDLEPHFQKTLPATGCTFLGNSAGTQETVPCRFIAFTKRNRPTKVQGAQYSPPGVQSTNGQIYSVTMTYDMDGFPVCGRFHVSVQGDLIAPLKECKPTNFKTGRRGTFTRMVWDYPVALVDLADTGGKSIDETAKYLFSIAANAAMRPESGLTVKVQRGLERVAFAIDPLRTPYFFSNREKVVNENGKTKPILHIVRTHRRKSGQVIKSHWRGLREFSWNGYNVKIGMGDKHFRNFSDFNGAAVDAHSDEYGKTLTASEASQMMKDYEVIQ